MLTQIRKDSILSMCVKCEFLNTVVALRSNMVASWILVTLLQLLPCQLLDAKSLKCGVYKICLFGHIDYIVVTQSAS